VFEVSKRRHEVVHWIRGSGTPSVTWRQCEVSDRDNWTCTREGADGRARAIEMQAGQLSGGMPDAGPPVHQIAKWRWWLFAKR
jgi:hypothetical protein